ncbi:MAG: phage holin family protein [Deltaproteobacteria bacterium]|nr:phage holin family protein [Deltaproteobacteria bacterium]
MMTWAGFLKSASYASGKLADGWQYKILFSAPVLAYQEFLGGDAHLLIVLYAFFGCDMIVGLISAIKGQVFSLRRAELWVVKLIVYSLCILIVGFVNLSITRTVGFHVPILDIVIAIMITSEAISVLRNLHKITGLVPDYILRFVEKVNAKANRRFDDLLDDSAEKPWGGLDRKEKKYD